MVTHLVGIGIILMLSPALAFGGPSSLTPTITASVVDIVDSSTITVSILAVSGVSLVLVGDSVHIHLIGIELTETGTALWEENADMPIARTVYLAVDSVSAISWKGGDQPLPAYVFLDPEGKTLVNSLLIAMGFAAEVASSASAQAVTSAATSEAQAEASSTTIAEASTAATIATGEDDVPTSVDSPAVTPGT